MSYPEWLRDAKEECYEEMGGKLHDGRIISYVFEIIARYYDFHVEKEHCKGEKR